MLHAGIALAGADRLIERVLAGGGAEHLHVAAAEQLLAGLAQRHLADRHQGQALHDLAGALGFGVEGFHVLQRVAEEVEAHGGRAAGREQVEDAAAHGVLAGLHDGAAAREARQVEALDQLAHVEALARRDGLERAADELARRGALQDGVDGGDDDGRVLAARSGEARERGDAPRHDLAVGADAVVGHRVPGGKLDDLHLGGEEGEALGNRLEAPVVAGDVQQERRRRAGRGLALDQAAEQQGHQAVGHAAEHHRLGGARRFCARCLLRLRHHCNP